MDNFDTKLQSFVELYQKQYTEYMNREFPCSVIDYSSNNPQYKIMVKPGIKYTKIDVNHSGHYMIENETGDIYGIKGYGVIHRGHYYGNLDTVNDWYWGGYRAIKVTAKVS